jgi:arylsulfatase A-like enzyme
MKYCCVLFALIFTICPSRTLFAVERPNIVFILADDLGYGELGCYGQQKIKTPHIDRLASEGMRFTRHYSGAPVCAPSRNVLMTGKHLGHAEIRGNRQASISFPQYKEGQHPIAAETVTVAQLFQQNGYATAAIGKWGLGPVGSSGAPDQHGFDFFYGYNCQAVAHSYYPRYLWRNNKQEEINPQPIPGGAKQLTGEVTMEKYIGQQYAPDLMVKEATNFINQNKEKPFFLYLAFIEPHVAMHPPVDRVNDYPKEWDTEPYRGDSGYLPHPRPRAAYAAMITDLDDHVGKVMKSLEENHLTEKTLVVFTSDNGATHEGKAGQHFHIGGADPVFFNSTLDLKGYKGSVYEGGLRVPMIVRYPGKIKAGSTNETPGYFADWLSTLCAAASISNKQETDGVNLFPTMLDGTRQIARNPMLWVYPEYSGQVAVNFGDIKVIKTKLLTKKPAEWEVYDLSKDRGETKNLATDQPQWIEKAKAVLKDQTDNNLLFPMKLPE